MSERPDHQPERRIGALVAAIAIVVGGLAPPGLHAAVWGRAPELGAEEALDVLESASAEAVLVDVRPRAEFERRHLRPAAGWPVAEIELVSGPEDVPDQFRGKTLFLICEAGLSSAVAGRWLHSRGLLDVYSVSGGMQAWVGECARREASAFCQFGSRADRWEGAPFDAMTLAEQWAAVLSGFVVKPLYMLGALALIIYLWRVRATDGATLRWGLAAFLAGEACCAVSYLFFQGRSMSLEYWHAYGMVVAFGFVGFAAMTAIDGRFLHLSDEKPCASLRMCGVCVKNRRAPCAARRLFLLVSSLGGTLAFIPLLAPIRGEAYNTVILGTSYTYSHPVVIQLFELRYCAVLALLLLGGAFAALFAAPGKAASPLARGLFAAGIGALGFGLLRLGLNRVFQGSLVWASFWEEWTELEFVAGIALVLWIYRGRRELRPGAATGA